MSKRSLEEFYIVNKSKMSITISSLFVVVLGFIFERVGIKVGSEEIGTFINVALQIGGVIGIYIGRIRKGDLNWFGGRITK